MAVAQADEAELRVQATAAAAVQVRLGLLENAHHLHQLRSRETLGEGPEGLFLIAAGEQALTALGGGFADEQIPDQGG